MRLLLVRDCLQSGSDGIMPREFLDPAHVALQAAAEYFLVEQRTACLPQLIAGLNSTLRATRVAACDLLATYKAEASVAVPRLLEIATSTHEQERISALTALVAIGRGDVPEVEYARKLLALLNEAAGVGPLPYVVRAFRHVNDQALLQNLFELCRDPEIDSDTNAEAMLLYEAKFPGAAMRWVIDTIRSGPADEMSGAYENAVQIATPESPAELAEVLEAKLRDPEIEDHNRDFAIDALGKLGERGRAALLHLAAIQNSESLGLIAVALTNVPGGMPDALRLLATLSEGEPNSDALSAFNHIGQMDAQREAVTPFLASLIKAQDNNLWSRLALGFLGGLWCNQPRAPMVVFEAFERAIESGEPDLRFVVFKDLTRMRWIPPTFVPNLSSALAGVGGERVGGFTLQQMEWVFAGLKAAGEAALPARLRLLGLVNEPRTQPEIRRMAAEVLGGFAQLNEAALTALEAMAYDDDPKLRLAGVRGLALRTDDPERSLQAFIVLEELIQLTDSDVRRTAYELIAEAAVVNPARRDKALPLLAALAREPIGLAAPFDARDVNQGLAHDCTWYAFATRRSWAISRLLRFGDAGIALAHEIFAEDETFLPAEE